MSESPLVTVGRAELIERLERSEETVFDLKRTLEELRGVELKLAVCAAELKSYLRKIDKLRGRVVMYRNTYGRIGTDVARARLDTAEVILADMEKEES